MRGLALKSMQKAVLTAFAVLAIGLILISIPYSGPSHIEVERDSIVLHKVIGWQTDVSLRRGVSEVCIEDKNPGIQDYGSFEFDIDGGDYPIAIERSDGTIQRDIDGTKYEVVCSLTVTRSGTYLYQTSTNGTDLNGTRVDVVFIREATRLDQPTFLAGVGLVATGLVVIPIAIMLLRQPARPPEVGRTGEGPPTGPAPADTEARP